MNNLTETSHKFQVGDVIETLPGYTGFEKATILGTFTEEKGIHKGKEMYLLKILCGTATMPISAENNYQLYKGRK